MTARRLLILGPALAAALIPAGNAGAAGLPIASVQSSRVGAIAPGGTERLIAKRAGADTTVSAVRRGTRRLLRSQTIAGRWNIPAVTLDNQTTGLSADGGTLVLVHRTRAFPSKVTRLIMLDAQTLAVRRHTTLRGFFTVDAISPDGDAAYLIQYPSTNDFLDYRVRALDTRTGTLASQDVVDPREPDEQIGGIPYTRVMSPDGRWAYTLYGGGEETFIHALDTTGATAACIDLDMVSPGADFSRMRLKLTGDGLVVYNDGDRLAVVNPKTFAVRDTSPVTPDATARPAAPKPAPDTNGFPWPVVPIIAGVAALAAAVLRAVRRARSADDITISTRVP